MNPNSVTRRIAEGGAVHFDYRRDNLVGLINAWKHGTKLIVTWEECQDGDQLDESAYTLDERHEFDSATELLKFLVQRGIDVLQFRA